MRRAAMLVGSALAALVGCGNPVQDAKIDALPPEVQGVPQGEFHRPGQPCTLCHSDYGGAPTFSVAGTIFTIPAVKATDEPHPADKARVELTDTTGNIHSKVTNCVGNFFFTPDEFDPQYPLHAVVEVTLPPPVGKVRKVMGTRINREGSCGECHVKNHDESSPGWVWVLNSTVDPTKKPDPAACQGAANFP